MLIRVRLEHRETGTIGDKGTAKHIAVASRFSLIEIWIVSRSVEQLDDGSA
jgi:hypothetical protein